MHATLYNQDAPKRPTNLSINSDLLRLAREYRINLSQALEKHLAELLRKEQSQRWLAENRKALEAYTERVARRGVFSDGLRRF